ncbi:hypothetical protein [Marinicella rhabdoformis]|uniref:hypothetical protein n=1 Tax=Marinicella rhabdoformis TaxID=2580566 RepID=UPI0012AED5FF|nr:hypothetical protein [Marinicella rhabdoformis]
MIDKKQLFTIFIGLVFTINAKAETILVNKTCTFTDAIHAANNDEIVGGCSAGNGSDLIVFVEADQVLSVNQGLHNSLLQHNVKVAYPSIDSAVTIEGNGLHIQADTRTENFRVMDMIGSLGERLILRNLTISGGDDGSGIGSGLFVFGGRLTLENVRFTENRGALLLLEVLDVEINHVLIDNNWTDSSSPFSAGLESKGSDLVIKNSSIVNNHVRFDGTDFKMSPSHAAGGIGLSMSFPATIVNSTISGNTAITGGGLVIKENSNNLTGTTGNLPGIKLEIIHTTISNNSALFGGGVVVFESAIPVSFSHTLIAGNISDQSLGSELWVADGVVLFMDDFNVIKNHHLSPNVIAALGDSDLISNQTSSQIVMPLTQLQGLSAHPLPIESDAIDSGSTSCFTANDQLHQLRPADGNKDGTAQCDSGSIEFVDLIYTSGFENTP